MLIKGLARLFIIYRKVMRRVKMLILRRAFASVGRNFVFCPDDLFSYETIHIGDDVFIGSGAKFSASESSISIGDKVMFGPGVTIMGGDHNTSVIGRYMSDIKDKRPQDDMPVVIEKDVWVAANAIILKGVTIGRGSIVAAGAIVTKSMPPYSIIGGIPAKVIKPRFESQDLEKHIQMIGE